MAIEVRTEQAAPRRLAAVRSVTTPRELGQTIGRSLGMVWPTRTDIYFLLEPTG